jgi:hypothetical protein
MRRLILALALSLTLTTGCARAPAWKLLGATVDQSIVFYYDPSTIQRDRDIASVWELADYPSGHTSRSGVAFRSKKEQNRYDCKAETFSLGTAVYFDGNMASGNIISSDNTSTEWIPAPADSVWAGKMEVACHLEHHRAQRRAPPAPVATTVSNASPSQARTRSIG